MADLFDALLEALSFAFGMFWESLWALILYRTYYGWKMAGFLFVTFFAAMAGAAFAIELAFEPLGLIPGERDAKVVEASVSWNYKTFPNIAFPALAAVLVWRFFRTGGLPMLRMMNTAWARSRGLASESRHVFA